MTKITSDLPIRTVTSNRALQDQQNTGSFCGRNVTIRKSDIRRLAEKLCKISQPEIIGVYYIHKSQFSEYTKNFMELVLHVNAAASMDELAEKLDVIFDKLQNDHRIMEENREENRPHKAPRSKSVSKGSQEINSINYPGHGSGNSVKIYRGFKPLPRN